MEMMFSGIFIRLFILVQISGLNCKEMNETNPLYDNPFYRFERSDRSKSTAAKLTTKINNQINVNQTVPKNPKGGLNNTQLNTTKLPVQKALNAPYQAHIKFDTYKGNILVCCATIVGPRTLLSAAYCFDPTRYGLDEDYPITDMLEFTRAFAGVDNQEMVQWHNLVQYVDNDEYNHEAFFFENDIALLFIEGSWIFNDVVKPINILTTEEDLRKRNCEIGMFKITAEIGFPYDDIKSTLTSEENKLYHSKSARTSQPKISRTRKSATNKYNNSELDIRQKKRHSNTFVRPNILDQYSRPTLPTPDPSKVVTKPVIRQILSKVSLLPTQECETDLEQKGYFADILEIICVDTKGNNSLYWEYTGGPLVCYFPEYEDAIELGIVAGILSQTVYQDSKAYFTKTAAHVEWMKSIMAGVRFDKIIPFNSSDPEITIKSTNNNNQLTGYITNVLVSNMFSYVLHKSSHFN